MRVVTLPPATPEITIDEWVREPPIPRTVHRAIVPPEKLLQEVLRHFIEVRGQIAQGSDATITHTYVVSAIGVSGECPDNPSGDRPRPHRALGLRCVHCGGQMRRVSVHVNYWDVSRALASLDHRHREVLVLCVLADMGQRSVARRLGVTPGAIGRRLDRALRQLAERVDVETSS